MVIVRKRRTDQPWQEIYVNEDGDDRECFAREIVSRKPVFAGPVPDDAEWKEIWWLEHRHNLTSPDNSNKRDNKTQKRKMTYPFRKQSVTRTEAATVAETHTAAWDASLVVHDDILLVVADEVLEPLHEFWVSTNKGARAMDEDCAIDEVLAE